MEVINIKPSTLPLALLFSNDQFNWVYDKWFKCCSVIIAESEDIPDESYTCRQTNLADNFEPNLSKNYFLFEDDKLVFLWRTVFPSLFALKWPFHCKQILPTHNFFVVVGSPPGDQTTWMMPYTLSGIPNENPLAVKHLDNRPYMLTPSHSQHNFMNTYYDFISYSTYFILYFI